jgi:hypothetical protein
VLNLSPYNQKLGSVEQVNERVIAFNYMNLALRLSQNGPGRPKRVMQRNCSCNKARYVEGYIPDTYTCLLKEGSVVISDDALSMRQITV